MVARVSVIVIALVAGLSSAPAPAPQQAAAPRDNVILITLDGVRATEIFGGLDADILRSTLAKDARLEDSPAYKRFNAATAAERRARLMPFFWTELMAKHGSIAGNSALGSAVTLTNTHRFSYPGYSEIVTGEAHDDVIKSNDRIQNPYPTVLEGLKERLTLPASAVATFGSWEVFNEIAEHTPGNLTINAGYEEFATSDPAAREMSRMQFQTPTAWDSARHDAYTFYLAMSHFKAARPRAVYLAFDETDDWAHSGRYDRVLDALSRTDGYLKELWSWLQSQPDYQRTHILITTDHGRGKTADEWKTHGAKIDGAQNTWIAFISPSMPQRGEWRDHSPLHTNQIAATIASWMGVDWTEGRPGVGRAIK
jgi:hypothetical protein